MDIQLEKYKLMEWLINLEDESIISKLKSLKQEYHSSDWNEGISDSEKIMIEAGLKDIEEGNIFKHEDILREIKESYGL